MFLWLCYKYLAGAANTQSLLLSDAEAIVLTAEPVLTAALFLRTISMMQRSKGKGGLAFILGLTLIAGLLQTAGYMKGDELVFPGVVDILKAFLRLLAPGRTYLLIFTTLKHLIFSMAAVLVTGVVIGIA